MPAGYSGTPLIKKLGIKPGHRIFIKNPPKNYFDLVFPIPDDTAVLKRPGKNIDVIHFFVKSRKELVTQIEGYMERIQQDGMIWISWPKKSSKVPTDMTEGVIREVCLPMGLVDIKVCAVDEIWSALKLVIRKELRKKK